MKVVRPAIASVPIVVFQALNLKYRSMTDPSDALLTRPGPSIAPDRPDMPIPLSLRERPQSHRAYPSRRAAAEMLECSYTRIILPAARCDKQANCAFARHVFRQGINRS